MAKEMNVFGGDAEITIPVGNVPVQASGDDAIVEKQWTMYTRARDAGHLDWVEEARKFDDYYFGEQWDENVKNTLDAQKRPAHTINMILSTVNAVVGEYIKSRQDISFQPMGKGASQETAKSLRFLFKQIATNNKSEQKEKQMFMDGLIQDRGYVYYYLDFSDNIQGEVREEIVDPTDIILDPGAKEYDPRTWSEVYVSRWMTPDEIGALYGPEFRDKVDLAAGNGTFGHDSLEWEAPNFGGTHYDSEVYFQAPEPEIKKVKRIRVIERQYRTLTRTAFFVDAPTGDMRRVPEGWEKERSMQFAAQNDLLIIWKPERRIRVTITADKVLLHDGWSLFNQISVIPFFPYFRRGRPFGLVRNLLSPQDMLNKVTSQELHVVNTTANSGWIFQAGSLINMDRDDLVTQGSKTGLVLEVAKGAEMPIKIQPNQIPTGLSEIGSKAGVYFGEISGVNKAQLGSERSDSSKALNDRKQGGLAQQEIIFDNLDYTRELRAEIMLEIVQNYYTETRLLQVFEKNEDGDDVQREIAINEPVEQIDPDTQEAIETIKNDLTLGEYSIVITSIARRETYEESLFDQMMQLREVGVQIPDYALVAVSSHPEKEELVEVIKQIQGMAAPTEEEIERAQALQELELRMLTAEVVDKEASAMERQANAQKLQAQAQESVAKPQIDQLRIGTEARVEMEKMGAAYQQNQDDLMTRIRIAQGKESTMTTIAQIESMTTRNATGIKGRVDLQKALLKLQESKTQDSSTGKKSDKKSAAKKA